MEGCHFREDIFIKLIELPIQILSAVARSEIAGNDSIGVEHRNDVEDEGIS